VTAVNDTASDTHPIEANWIIRLLRIVAFSNDPRKGFARSLILPRILTC
jgi:hypothetical protein